MENLNESNVSPKRHGCITAWLIYLTLANSVFAVMYLFMGDFLMNNLPAPYDISKNQMLVLGAMGLMNVFFAVLLFRWKRIGFWGFVLINIAATIVNFSIGFPRMSVFSSLVGIAILFGLFQIKRDGVAAWKHLK